MAGKKIFTIANVVFKTEPHPTTPGRSVVGFQQSAGILLCESKEEAERRGLAIALDRYPEADGWMEHACCAAEMPLDDFLWHLREAARTGLEGEDGEESWPEELKEVIL